MARVFTITPGLENMGGLKTGGQGSIYKGRRIGEIVTAVKILPTPVTSEKADDKTYAAFENEVTKLKKVNETPNPNVVKILSSGISETGGFPYIEMEYIEGPDLEELLQSPNYPIFAIQETLKVAEQLANALAHCHKVDVRHGDINSNNVKFNSNTGNYILLDFGLAIMSDEQRRSSLMHTGSIEFMAPEQNTGQMLFQTDVYSYGVILFELLCGTVPFPLKDKGETARNEVRLAHMVSPVPNLMELRSLSLPDHWSYENKQIEMQVPEWFVKLIYKCLEKKPENRFANGIELCNYIAEQIILKPHNAYHIKNPPQTKKHAVVNQEELKKQLSRYREELLKKEGELKILKSLLATKETKRVSPQVVASDAERRIVKNSRVSIPAFVALLLVTIFLAASVIFPFSTKKKSAKPTLAHSTKKRKALHTASAAFDAGTFVPTVGRKAKMVQHSPATRNGSGNATFDIPADSTTYTLDSHPNKTKKVEQKTAHVQAGYKAIYQKNNNNQEPGNSADQTGEIVNAAKKTEKPAGENDEQINSLKNGISKKYLVVSKAYIYNDAEENTKRNEFISQTEKAVVKALNERYGFIYVVITNPGGQVFKGWLRKRDLKLHSVE